MIDRRPPLAGPLTDEEREDLRAIAFLYLACCELTDEDLSSGEVGVIVARIHTWMPVVDDERIASALRDASATYARLEKTPARLEHLGAVAARLADRLDEELRARIVDDLIALAHADGRVIPAEIDFIEAAARTLGIKLTRLPGA